MNAFLYKIVHSTTTTPSLLYKQPLYKQCFLDQAIVSSEKNEPLKVPD